MGHLSLTGRFLSWLDDNIYSVESWDKGQVVADMGRNPLWDNCPIALVAVRLGLVRATEITGPSAECRKSHAGWDGENADGDCACGLALGTG